MEKNFSLKEKKNKPNTALNNVFKIIIFYPIKNKSNLKHIIYKDDSFCLCINIIKYPHLIYLSLFRILNFDTKLLLNSRTEILRRISKENEI